MHTPTKFITLDFKTTGFTPNSSVISCSVVDQDGSVLLDTLVNPDDAIDFHPLENFHNISMDDVSTRGISTAELYESLFTIFSQHSCIVIYNAKFDKSFIPNTLLRNKTIYCAMDLSIGFLNNHPSFQSVGQYLKLNCLASLLEINTIDVDASTSLGDAELCRRVWLEMSKSKHNLETPFKTLLSEYLTYTSRAEYDFS